MTVPFRVTAPAGAQPGTSTLNARVSFQPGPGSSGGAVLASTTVSVPYSSLAVAYNNIGISDNSDPAAANYDLAGNSYSAQALAAGTPNALTPGGQVTIGGTTFTWPNVAAGTVDNVVANGQTVALTGSGTDLGILGASQNGTATGTITVNYTDGTSQSFTLNMADWYANAPAAGRQIAHHHIELEPGHPDRRAPGERLLRVGAARGGQDRGVGDAALAARLVRPDRAARLRPRHRLGHADELIARAPTAARPGGRPRRAAARARRRHGLPLP